MHILLLCVWSFPRWVFLCGSSHWYFSMALSWCKIQTFEKLQCYNYCSYCFLSYKLVLKACFVLLKHNFWMYQTHITAKWFIFLADIYYLSFSSNAFLCCCCFLASAKIPITWLPALLTTDSFTESTMSLDIKQTWAMMPTHALFTRSEGNDVLHNDSEHKTCAQRVDWTAPFQVSSSTKAPKWSTGELLQQMKTSRKADT